MLSARPIPVDGTRSDAWDLHSVLPVVLLPRGGCCHGLACAPAAARWSGRGRRDATRSLSSLQRAHQSLRHANEAGAHTWRMCAIRMQMAPCKLCSLACHPWDIMAEGSQLSEALDTMVCLLG